MDLAAVAGELYASLPAEFTASRNEQAKTAKAEGNPLLAKQIGRLPKPSTAAWAINLLARRHGDELAQLLDLGASLRRAQEDLDPDGIRDLGQQRRVLLAAVVREARTAAQELGVRVSDAAASEVEQTLHAAMADEQAAMAVSSGQLVSGFASNGLDPVDVSGVVAVPGLLPALESSAGEASAARSAPREPDGGRTARARGSKGAADGGRESAAGGEGGAGGEEARRRAEEELRREREQARAELDEAERGVEQAEAELDDAERQAADVSERRARLSGELKQLRERLAEVEEDLAAVEREAGYAERTRKLASRLAEQERRAAQRARERWQRLT